jgi:hypothetical protein
MAALALTANAQFKEVGPPPVSAPVARQQIRGLLEKVDPDNRKQTLDKLSSLLVWYRDTLDDEIIAAWKKDTRANLTLVMEPMADARVASEVVEFSWREARQETFGLTYAPMLGQLMARYPASSRPFLDDLLAPQPPALSPSVAEAVCRILLDAPDTGTWKQNAIQILPHYRDATRRLLNADIDGSDREKGYRAQVWMSDLKMTPPPSARNEQANPRRRTLLLPSGPVKSGTLQCDGSLIPQNGEYVFFNLPLGNIRLDLDARIWDARLAPGGGDTQRLIIRNKASGTQKRCVVHWSVIP